VAEAVRELAAELDLVTRTLAVAGYPEPRRTAVRLLADLAGVGVEEVLGVASHGSRVSRPVAGRDGRVTRDARLTTALSRLLAGEPIQYVTGVAGFRRLTLHLDRRALIPRPETEGLVDLALGRAPHGHALDLGTGSGCLALALADEGAYASVTAVDRSPEALEVARENGARLGLAVRWLGGSWCGPVQGERFDLIVANPPYIAEAELAGLDPLVRDWEPRAALDGGPDGLRDVARVLDEAPSVLAEGGWLCMEVDASRAGASGARARHAGWQDVGIEPDLFGRPRYLVARRGAEG
jgi:release factor glutamine methyltransferase